jgi:hypothetical protein
MVRVTNRMPEMKEKTMNQKRSANKFAFLFPVGLGIGTALGALLHNIGVGLAIGAGIGTVMSLIGWHFSNQES